MKLLLVPNSYPPQVGGLEVVVSSIVAELAGAGHRVTVVTTGSSVLSSKWVEPNGVAVRRIPLFLPRVVTAAGRRKLLASLMKTFLCPFVLPKSLIQFLLFVKKVNPDVINLHYVAENAFFCLAAKRILGSKLMVTVHGSDVEGFGKRGALTRALTLATLRGADRVSAVSSDLLEKAIKIEPLVAGKSEVIGNAIDPEGFVMPEGRPETDYLLSIGNFSGVKGQDILISALARLRDTRIRLLLAGDGPKVESCRKLATDLGLGQRVVFLGMVARRDIPKLIRGCRICVVASRRESFGLTALEAMAARKPVVATRVGGLKDILRHNETGLLVEPEAPDALAEAVDLLLADTALADRLGDQGHALLLKEYTWGSIIGKYLAAYQKVSSQ